MPEYFFDMEFENSARVSLYDQSLQSTYPCIVNGNITIRYCKYDFLLLL